MFKLILSTVFLLGLFTNQIANAKPAPQVSPSWITVSSLANKFNILGSGQSLASTVSFSSVSSPKNIWYYNDNIISQSPLSIKGVVEKQFKLVAGSLKSKGDGEVSSFSKVASFDYLAVHFGRGELLFHWTKTLTSFSISGLPRAFSNYRTYSGVSPVPEVETYIMMLLGLGFIGWRVRNSKHYYN